MEAATTSKTSVIERVRRLLALAKSDNVNEAANAAALAQRLMAQHELEQAELDVETSAPDEPIERDDLERSGRKTPWKGVLAAGLAMANNCVAVWGHGAQNTRVLQVVGPASNVATTRYLYAYLVREIDRLVDAEKRTVGSAADRAYTNAFRLGAASTISSRVATAAREQKAQNAQAGSGAALARIDSTLARTKAAVGPVTRGAPATHSNAGALYRGSVAARNVAIGGSGPALGRGSFADLRG